MRLASALLEHAAAEEQHRLRVEDRPCAADGLVFDEREVHTRPEPRPLSLPQ
jgi:hypothetical protein